MKTYTLEKLTALLDKHGIKYFDAKDDDYICVKSVKPREVTIELTLSEDELPAIGHLINYGVGCILGGRMGASLNSVLSRIRYLTRDVYDYKNMKWRKHPLSKSLGNYKCGQSEREFNKELSDD